MSKNTKSRTKPTRLATVKSRSINTKHIDEMLDVELASITKTEAIEFVRLVEEQRNAEQVERTRKLRIKALMKKAGTRSSGMMEGIIRRLLRS